MTRLIPYIVAALAVGAVVWWVVSTMADNERLSGDNARLTRNQAVLSGQIEHARMSAQVAAARAKLAQQISADASAKIEAIRNLQLGDCADEEIPSDLADILGRRGVPADD